ncbi:MAG: hypothetical protein JRH11_11905 [Deltaproteobacteria bacterium]|nr:hypothetical protein [Deltaproteobacteria bacterium]
MVVLYASRAGGAKGANVVFGPNANVTIRGGMEIEEGANVRIEGDLEFVLEIIELGDGVPDEH